MTRRREAFDRSLTVPAVDADPAALVAALGPIGWSGQPADSETVDRIVACVRHQNSAVRWAALKPLRQVAPGEPRTVAALKWALRDEVREIREQAARELEALSALPAGWPATDPVPEAWRPRTVAAPPRSMASATALVKYGGDYRSVVEVLRDPSDYLAHLLTEQDLGCCDFQLGFEIAADGVVWCSRDNVDEIWNVEFWLTSLADLFEGETEIRICAWEESGMTAWRLGDDVVLEDIHHSGTVCVPRAAFGLRQLASALIEPAQLIADLVDLLEEQLRGRYDFDDTDLRADVARLETALAAHRG